MQSLVSTDGGVCFYSDLVFQKQTSSLCECCILKSVDL